MELLSREVMKVVIPKDTVSQTIKDHLGKDVVVCDAHVATPYGVSGHLLIPVVNATAAAASDFSPASIDGCLIYSGCVAKAITLPPGIKVNGAKPADGKPKVSVAVVFGDGTEVKLSADGLKDGKPAAVPEFEVAYLASGIHKDSLELEAVLNNFLGCSANVFSHQKPVALKVTAKVILNSVETTFGGPLFIRLVGAACGSCPSCSVGAPCSEASTPTPAAMACEQSVLQAPIPATVRRVAPEAPGRSTCRQLLLRSRKFRGASESPRKSINRPCLRRRVREVPAGKYA